MSVLTRLMREELRLLKAEGTSVMSVIREVGEAFGTSLEDLRVLLGRPTGEAAPAPLSEQQVAMCRRAGVDPSAVAEEVRRMRAERESRARRANGPLTFTDEEAAELRRHGHDPDLLARMHEVRTTEDYKRVCAEVRGGE